MKLKFKESPTPGIEKGQVVEVDKIKFSTRSASGILVRVINPLYGQAWWDLGHFMEIPEEYLEASLQMAQRMSAIPF